MRRRDLSRAIRCQANERRKAAAMCEPGLDGLDGGLRLMFTNDARRLDAIAAAIDRGDLARARRLHDDTDTAVTELLPPEFYDLLEAQR